MKTPPPVPEPDIRVANVTPVPAPRAVLPVAPLELPDLNEHLLACSAEQIIQWGIGQFGARLALQSSMQKTAGVLMHMVSRLAPATPIIFVDTGVHFPETLDLRDEFAQRYGLTIESHAPARSFDEQYEDFGGRSLYLHDDKADPALPGYQHCCMLRKEQPFLAAVQGRFEALISGLMRSEGGARSALSPLVFDPRFGGYKLHPLVLWTPQMVDDYTAQHDLPVHPLYAKRYTSIGCWTCTTPVRPGEDKRAGRWRHIREAAEDASQPLYCGINLGETSDGQSGEGI